MCCAFNKAYKVLTDSRKGCLSDKELYSTALFVEQAFVMSSYVEDRCLTTDQYDLLFRQLKLSCGCCTEDVNDPTYPTINSQICYWYLDIIASPNYKFIDWTIDGQPFLTNYTALTGHGSNPINNQMIDTDERIIWQHSTQNDLPNIPVYKAGGGVNPSNPIYWKQGACEQTCWEVTIPSTELNIYSLRLGIDFIGPILTVSTWGSQINVSNPVHISYVQTYYQSVFGPQVTVTSVMDMSGDYVVTINNTYENINPEWTGSFATFTFNQIAC